MRILHSLAPAHIGGLEEVVLGLSAGLQRRGHAVAVAAVVSGEPGRHPFLRELRDHDIETFPLVVPPRRYLREAAGLRELCERWHPEVIHTHGYRSDVLHGRVGRELGIPRVTTLHGFTGGGWKNRAYQWLQLRTVCKFEAVVVVSRPLREALLRRGFRTDTTHLIPNAWAPRGDTPDSEAARRELGVVQSRFHLGWVGRLSHEKGADVFLDALARMAGEEMDVSIVGDGPLREELERGIIGLRARTGAGRGPHVRLHGAVPHAARLFPGFDAFVLSSRTEGTPIVLFEAMAAGVPIVATAVGGVPDVVGAEEAVLVPPEDPQALAEAVLQVIAEPRVAWERAFRAGERVKAAFDAGAWVEQYEALYSGVLRGHGLRRENRGAE